MSKTKSGAKIPKKPAVEAPAVETKEQKSVKVIDATKFMEQARNPKLSGLDANHRVDLAVLNHKIFGEDPEARAKYGDSTVESMNEITAVMAISETVTEAMTGNSAFSMSVKKAYLPQLINVAQAMGVTIDQKLLPASTKENDVVEIPAAAMKPSKEVKEDIKKDVEIKKNVPTVLDVTKINTDEELKSALTFILGESMSPANNLAKAVEFYRSVKSLQASKSEGKEDAIAEIKNMPFNTILQTILQIVDKVPYVTVKIADNMRTITGVTKSVVPAFCTMRDAVKNRKTGIPMFEDKTIADIVKTLVEYSANACIESHKKDLEVLNGDKEKNAVAIESKTNSIAYLESIIEMINCPSAESIDLIVNNYDNKEDAVAYKSARRVFSNVAKTYYGSLDLKQVKQDVLKNNIKIYMGIITNLFRDPMSQIEGYSESGITELTSVQESEETKK